MEKFTLTQFLLTNTLYKTSGKGDFSNKNVPIYITGAYGPQGKTTLKHLLIEEGYTNVTELADCNYFDPKKADKLDALNKTKYIENGIIFDFGDKFLF